MIDLHAHVLPGLDDGPGQLEDSLALLRAASQAGTRTIVATPHLRHDHPRVDPQRIASEAARLMEHVPADWDIRVMTGGEVDYMWALEACDDDLRAASYGGRGRDLLVETPHRWVPDFFDEALRCLRRQGYRIILAHPELSRTFSEDRGRLAALVDAGTLLQITASSLERDPRRSSRAKFAHWLVRKRLVHLIASDAHSAGPRRPPDLRGAIGIAQRLAPERALWMATAAPAAVVTGRALPPVPDGRPLVPA